jgi:hypothetical protein
MRAAALAVTAVTLLCAARALPRGVLGEDGEDGECPPGMVYNACGTPCHKTCASEASGEPGLMCIQVREERDKSDREKGGGTDSGARGRERGKIDKRANAIGRERKRAAERAKLPASRTVQSGRAS